LKKEPIPGDLLASILVAVSTLAFTLIHPLSELPVRIPLGLAMVLFVPGYTFIAALFPRKDDLDGIERVALSFGLSIAVVPLIGLGLNYTPWGIRLAPIAISLAVFTVIMSSIAHLRRAKLQESERFGISLMAGVDAVKEGLVQEGSSKLDKALTVLLVISILASIFALAYVIIVPKQGETFTEFYILGAGGKAADYPTTTDTSKINRVIVGVVNHEYVMTNYTMRISVQNSTLLSLPIELEHNQTWEEPVNYTMKQPGDGQKLEFLLYREDNFTAPYRDLHLWVNVSVNKSNRPYVTLGSGQGGHSKHHHLPENASIQADQSQIPSPQGLFWTWELPGSQDKLEYDQGVAELEPETKDHIDSNPTVQAGAKGERDDQDTLDRSGQMGVGGEQVQAKEEQSPAGIDQSSVESDSAPEATSRKEPPGPVQLSRGPAKTPLSLGGESAKDIGAVAP
jgi:uncharacterized membrane protein